MKVWINEPNKIFPPIKSGKISSDDEAKLDDFLNKSHQTQGIYDGAGEVSFEIFRELIPKRADKDSQLTELVKVSRDNKGTNADNTYPSFYFILFYLCRLKKSAQFKKKREYL
ncbi:hypothetical protein AX774_g101 [Zancudomyces culisetae]|uniref:Uncharacterized protein n=1 Tax=Zancudomyces culisetae TaxID=1213189 RepID=A0A1R1PZF6_ZANCU|nr:hypothetical protein AX774_g101 [Zancudomyces culisetae]|eukprot:OMH86343.1 hypothetical protein AX774_g101 [Zancudomyces culisetae]